MASKPAKFLTTAQVAEDLGVTDARVRQLCIAGVGGVTRVGRDWLISAAAVEEMRKRAGRGRPAKNPLHSRTRGEGRGPRVKTTEKPNQE
jgi:excisionase family DNA binding protein